jgi:hypothetical protein
MGQVKLARWTRMRHPVVLGESALSGTEGCSNQMIRSGRHFWIFHVTFWGLAAAALFAYGLTYGHFQVALVRNLYNPLVGFAFSYLMKTIYDNRFPSGFGLRMSLIVGLSLLGALVSALVVNPITFGLLGYDIGELPLRNLLQDGLYFVLLYLVWSLLYLQLTGRSLAPVPADTTGMGTISVTKGNQVFKLDLAKIACIKASGDYVELFTGSGSYLKHGTISSYEKELDKDTFLPVHRSVIVNRDHVVSVSGPAKGQFWITLRDGQEIRSSRGYKEVVESLVPAAP